MNIVTIADLKRLNACSPGVEWARSVVPTEGMPCADLNKAIPRADWLIWWLDKSGQANARQLVMLGVVAARPSAKYARPEDREVVEAAYQSAENWARNPTPENAEAARFAARTTAKTREAAAAPASRIAAKNVAWAAAWAAREAAEDAAWAVRRAVEDAASAGVNPQESADLCRAYMATEEYQRLGKERAELLGGAQSLDARLSEELKNPNFRESFELHYREAVSETDQGS